MSTVETPGPGPDPLLRADRAPHRAPSSTSCAPPPTTTPTRRRIDNGARGAHLRRAVAEAAGDVADRPARRGRRPGRPGRRPDPVGHRPTSTSRSSASCSPAPPTCPVDADDPDERARLVFGEADVAAVVGRPTWSIALDRGRRRAGARRRTPTSTDDAWIIFTSGSTGTPEGRRGHATAAAAAFVDAEARLFLQDEPLGPGDRVLAGLSVAFDASLRGDVAGLARTAPAWCRRPRSLVRSGMDLGPWLVANDITVVSTVPTLVALWPAEALADVRLLIFGGEACPPELGARLATAEPRGLEHLRPHRGHRRRLRRPARPASAPVRIGLPLDGWDLAVVDAAGPAGAPTARPGELIIGGVGLARYLDPAKDAEKYAADADASAGTAPTAAATSSAYDAEGLVFVGRADDQVKLGGRRIELGEVDSALLGAARAWPARPPRCARTAAGQPAARRLRRRPTPSFDAGRGASRGCASTLPAALVPRLAVVDALPTRTSGKVDRDALPWPLPATRAPTAPSAPGSPAPQPGSPSCGSTSSAPTSPARTTTSSTSAAAASTAAQLVSPAARALPRGHRRRRLRAPAARRRWPRALDEHGRPRPRRPTARSARPRSRPRSARCVAHASRCARSPGCAGSTWVGARRQPARPRVLGVDLAADRRRGGGCCVGWLLLVTPAGPDARSRAVGARLLLRGVRPGRLPARRQRAPAAVARRAARRRARARPTCAGAPWMQLLRPGARRRRSASDVDLHSLPPVTGLLTLGQRLLGRARGRPRRLLARRRRPARRRGRGRRRRPGRRPQHAAARAPASATGAEVAPGSAVLGAGARRASAGRARPAARVGARPRPVADDRPAAPAAAGSAAYAASPRSLLACCPLVAVAARARRRSAPALRAARRPRRTPRARRCSLAAARRPWSALVVLALLIAGRACGCSALGLAAGHHPVHSRPAWQVWATERLLDEARTWLFPLYAEPAHAGVAAGARRRRSAATSRRRRCCCSRR